MTLSPAVDRMTVGMASPADAAEIWTLRCAANPTITDRHRLDLVYHETLGWTLSINGEYVVVARDESAIVGYLGFRPGRLAGTNERTVLVFILYVVESARRPFGAAFRLIRAARRLAQGAGYERVQIVTENEAVERFGSSALGLKRIGAIMEGAIRG